MVVFRPRGALLLVCFVSHAFAQGIQLVNGQIFTTGLAIINSPQPNTPMGGDTLHLSIEISSNGRLEVPPLPENFRNGIAGINIFLTSTITGLNLTISNGTFEGWDSDVLEAPEFLCNSTMSNGEENAGCQEIMLQESGSTVKHVNWVWPACLIGNGGANNGDCQAGGDLGACLDGTARGPYNVSFHESLRVNGSEFYTITDLPIRVTNSIPADTDLAKDRVRPRCDLRNNLLLPYDERNAAIRLPAGQVITDDAVYVNTPPASDDDKEPSTDPSNDVPLNPGNPGSGSLIPEGLDKGGSATMRPVIWTLSWTVAVIAGWQHIM